MFFYVMLSALGLIAYLRLGHMIGRASLDIWKKADNKSCWSYLLFPYHHSKGLVGREGHGWTFADDCAGSSDESLYMFISAVGWSIRTLINVPAILLTAPKVVPEAIRRERKLAAAGKEPETLDEMRDRLIELEAQRDDVDDRIGELKGRLEAELLTLGCEPAIARLEAKEAEAGQPLALAEANPAPPAPDEAAPVRPARRRPRRVRKK